MVFNATFNNISDISWRSALLVEEIGGPGENHRPVASHWQTWSHNVVHVALIEIRTHNTSGDSHWLLSYNHGHDNLLFDYVTEIKKIRHIFTTFYRNFKFNRSTTLSNKFSHLWHIYYHLYDFCCCFFLLFYVVKDYFFRYTVYVI